MFLRKPRLVFAASSARLVFLAGGERDLTLHLGAPGFQARFQSNQLVNAARERLPLLDALPVALITGGARRSRQGRIA